jgi:hypothetical protein
MELAFLVIFRNVIGPRQIKGDCNTQITIVVKTGQFLAVDVICMFGVSVTYVQYATFIRVQGMG